MQLPYMISLVGFDVLTWCLCREMQLFLLGYIVIQICEIFTVGEISPLSETVRVVSLGFTYMNIFVFKRC